MVLIFIGSGLVLQLLQWGITGAGKWAIGLLVPFVLLFPLFLLRMLGAGDIKLISAIGAIMGIHFVKEASLYICIGAGVMALVKMCYKGNFMSRMKHLYRYFVITNLSKQLQEYDNLHREDKSHVIRLSYAIALGSICQVFLELNDMYGWIG